MSNAMECVLRSFVMKAIKIKPLDRLDAVHHANVEN